MGFTAPRIDLTGKVVMVTGGSRGIGRAIVRAMASCGAHISLIYRQAALEAQEALEEIRSMGVQGIAIQCDASSHSQAAEAVEQTIRELGRIDILVNNVAISDNLPFLSMEPEQWQRAMAVNINSLYNFSFPVLHHMKERKSGHILNIGSICGIRPIAAVPVHYATSKGAMNAFTFTLAKEMARYNIAVNSIAPGLIETNFAMGLPEPRRKDFERFCPMRRIGRPEEVANLCVFVVSDLNTYMTGETIVMGGGL